jgi:phosphoglycerate dehydrogenase-like enzyme
MKLLIMIHHRFELWEAPDWFDQKLRQDFPDLEIVRLSAQDGNEEEFDDAEIIFTWSLKPEQLQRAAKLRWIHSPAAAVNQLMFPELVQSDVIVTNGRDVHGVVVAEQVMAMIFALARNLPRAMRLQAQHVWGQEHMWNEVPRPREVAGATLGLVGVGAIGREVAKRAAAMGMRVIATREDIRKEKPPNVDKVFAANDLSRLLAESDYVVLAAPVTAATQKLMDKKSFNDMKPEACLINVARGWLVDEAALAEALRSKKIGGAALDVFEKEPLPPDSPLWDLDNLLITPHTGGITEKAWERQYAFFADNLRNFMNGRPLAAMVDKRKGY